MSVRIAARVWAQSQSAGSELLMLLAIADFADDEGRAFPSVPTLARKCRMGERNAMYVLKSLQEQGQLRVHKGAGRRGTNLYQLVFPETQPAAPPQSAAPLQEAAPPQAPASL
jgi:hypothetical protein